jgi:GT2 family glycosyltransferase
LECTATYSYGYFLHCTPMKPLVNTKCSASLVLYNCLPEVFEPAITSFLDGIEDGILFVSDNSEVPLLHSLFKHPRVRYIFNNSNLGFGSAHNRAIADSGSEYNYHIILNPDITFGKEVIPHLISVMMEYLDIGVIMPRISYPDGSLQRLCKLLPTPIDLILRRFIPIKSVQNIINRRYELHGLPQDKFIDVPTMSGCFLIVRTELIRKMGGFDERFFMYLEDVDLVRRIGDIARVVYEPKVNVTHAYAKGSYRNKKLLIYHMASAIRYFTKWGWFFDPIRAERNSRTLDAIRNSNSC